MATAKTIRGLLEVLASVAGLGMEYDPTVRFSEQDFKELFPVRFIGETVQVNGQSVRRPYNGPRRDLGHPGSSRSPGKVRPAGSKLMRKAAEHKIGCKRWVVC